MNSIAGKLYRLRVSRYDNVSGMLLALLIVLGTLVACMLLVWLSNQIFASTEPVPITLEPIGDGDPPWGDGDDIEPPPAEETELLEEEIEEFLDAVADAVATRVAMLESPRPGGTGRGGGGTGTGRGGRPRRWEVQFAEGHNLDTYARQLDFFKIELGVLMTDNRVIYARNLAKGRPDRRTGPADTEQRYYLTWQRGGLVKADRELLDKAGIQHRRRLILKFLTKEMELELLRLEKQKAGNKSDRVRTTRYGILPAGSGFKFYVLKQTYR
jgi:hypothetical protein